jgi:pimeloyl-ACP methyl ester carboxylesterase
MATAKPAFGREALPTEPPAADASIKTAGRWFGPADRPLLGWLTTPRGLVGASGVLVAPPLGYQYWSSHRTLRTIAERLAGQGHTVLRIDYDATGDSAGDQWDAGRLGAWRASVGAGVAELRQLGARHVVLVGVRLGGTFALLDGGAHGADGVVAWAPVVSGKRYARELRLLGQAVPADARTDAPGAVAVAGCVFAAETLDALAAISLLDSPLSPPPRALLLGSEEADRLVARLVEPGCRAEHRGAIGGEQALELPTEYATVPQAIVAEVCAWIGQAGDDPVGTPAAPNTWARIPVGGAYVAEEVVELGNARLIGIRSEAEVAARPGGATVVFLNTGSESHVGPGRAWVEYARALALRGHRCLRIDFRGFGESPDDGHAPGRPYDAHCEADTIAIVAALRAQGIERIVLVGLCASSWIALQAVKRTQVDGVIALNPQLYWMPGDPIEATMVETRLRRTRERSREARGGRLGIWSALDVVGLRPRTGRWLDALRNSGVRVTLVFAAGDDGIEYLENRLARRFRLFKRAENIRIIELAEIDHSMHRVWLRGRVLDSLSDQLDAWFAS